MGAPELFAAVAEVSASDAVHTSEVPDPHRRNLRLCGIPGCFRFRLCQFPSGFCCCPVGIEIEEEEEERGYNRIQLGIREGAGAFDSGVWSASHEQLSTGLKLSGFETWQSHLASMRT